jgi:hypothetical protein
MKPPAQPDGWQPGWQTLNWQAAQPPVPGTVGALLQLVACPLHAPHWQLAWQARRPQLPQTSTCPG